VKTFQFPWGISNSPQYSPGLRIDDVGGGYVGILWGRGVGLSGEYRYPNIIWGGGGVTLLHGTGNKNNNPPAIAAENYIYAWRIPIRYVKAF
jgi:hypothetical protein